MCGSAGCGRGGAQDQLCWDRMALKTSQTQCDARRWCWLELLLCVFALAEDCDMFAVAATCCPGFTHTHVCPIMTSCLQVWEQLDAVGEDSDDEEDEEGGEGEEDDDQDGQPGGRLRGVCGWAGRGPCQVVL